MTDLFSFLCIAFSIFIALYIFIWITFTFSLLLITDRYFKSSQSPSCVSAWFMCLSFYFDGASKEIWRVIILASFVVVLIMINILEIIEQLITYTLTTRYRSNNQCHSTTACIYTSISISISFLKSFPWTRPTSWPRWRSSSSASKSPIHHKTQMLFAIILTFDTTKAKTTKRPKAFFLLILIHPEPKPNSKAPTYHTTNSLKKWWYE